MSPRVRLLTGAALACAALSTCVPSALAASYTVTSCVPSAGAPGWSASSAAGGSAADTCAAGGALAAALPDRPAGGSSAAWRFAAPAGTRVVRVKATRRTTGVAAAGTATGLAYAMTLDGRTLERCEVSDTSPCTADLDGTVEKPGLDGAALELRVTCGRGADEQCPGPLRVDASRVDVELADPAAPAVADVRIADDGERSGVLRVRFDATDAGGGLRRVLTLVDGRLRAEQPAGACNAALPVPCPLAVDDAEVALDVRTLPPGPHVVELRVEDAAGNVTTVFTTDFPKLNAPAPVLGASLSDVLRGSVRARFVESGTQRLTSRFGERVVVRGDLRTAAGRPIVGARIDVVHVLPGGRRLAKTGLKTREAGRFTLILPRDLRTRRIELAYRAVRPGPITSRRTLALTVRR